MGISGHCSNVLYYIFIKCTLYHMVDRLLHCLNVLKYPDVQRWILQMFFILLTLIVLNNCLTLH